MSTPDYDLVVIGGGAAGLTAAAAASILGAKTLLVERARLGGDCTWHGCIPSKALLRAAALAADARAASQFGIDATVAIDTRRVLERVRSVRERIYTDADSPAALQKYGVVTCRASARFLDRNTLALSGDGPDRVRASRIIIATGSTPTPSGLAIPTLDSDTLWELPELPKRLLVLGGGPVAVELAQALCRLGVTVTLVTSGKRLLERDSPQASAVITRVLEREGVRAILAQRVVRADGLSPIDVTLENGTTVTVDRVLSAVGRTANTDGLDLGVIGMKMDADIIAVDRRMRTNVPGVWAIGDCASTARFTHVAERMATVAIMNAIVGLPTRFDPEAIAWTTFTDPEIAQVGPTEASLRARGTRFSVETFAIAALDRAIVDGSEDGFVSILTGRGGRVLGGTVVGPHAGDTIAEIALARERRLPIGALSGTLHVYPTYALAVRRAADYATLRLRTPLVLGLLRRLRGLRGTAPTLASLLPPT